MERVSLVGGLHIHGISNSSVLQVGDSGSISPRNSVLAVQREVAFFIEGEGGFSNYPIFTMPLPQAPQPAGIRFERRNVSPFIRVGDVKVLAIASSAVIQIGNSCEIDAEARVLHIRQLLKGEKPVEGAYSQNQPESPTHAAQTAPASESDSGNSSGTGS